MADIVSWRQRVCHRPNTPSHDDKEIRSGHQTASSVSTTTGASARRNRPKLTSLFSSHRLTAHEKVEPELASVTSDERAIDAPPQRQYDPDVQLMAQAVMSSLAAKPHVGLPPSMNSLIMHVIEAYQKEVRSRVDIETQLAQQVDNCQRLYEQLQDILATAEMNESNYQLEIERLELAVNSREQAASPPSQSRSRALSTLDTTLIEVLEQPEVPLPPFLVSEDRRESGGSTMTQRGGRRRSEYTATNEPGREEKLSALLEQLPSEETFHVGTAPTTDQAPIGKLENNMLQSRSDQEEAASSPVPDPTTILSDDNYSTLSSVGGDPLPDESDEASDTLDVHNDQAILEQLAEGMARRKGITLQEARKQLANVLLVHDIQKEATNELKENAIRAFRPVDENSHGCISSRHHLSVSTRRQSAVSHRQFSFEVGDEKAFRGQDKPTLLATSQHRLPPAVASPISPFTRDRQLSTTSMISPLTVTPPLLTSGPPTAPLATRKSSLSAQIAASRNLQVSPSPVTSPPRSPADVLVPTTRRRNRQSSSSSMATVVRCSPGPALYSVSDTATLLRRQSVQVLCDAASRRQSMQSSSDLASPSRQSGRRVSPLSDRELPPREAGQPVSPIVEPVDPVVEPGGGIEKDVDRKEVEQDPRKDSALAEGGDTVNTDAGEGRSKSETRV